MKSLETVVRNYEEKQGDLLINFLKKAVWKTSETGSNNGVEIVNGIPRQGRIKRR